MNKIDLMMGIYSFIYSITLLILMIIINNSLFKLNDSYECILNNICKIGFLSDDNICEKC